METLTTLRDEYRTVCEEITTLDADIRAGNGPAMRAAADDLLRMRRQVDADRPYGHAVTAVMEQWADADAAYNDTLRMIEHARTQLDLLRATPDADELDIASARQDDRLLHRPAPRAAALAAVPAGPRRSPGCAHRGRRRRARSSPSTTSPPRAATPNAPT